MALVKLCGTSVLLGPACILHYQLKKRRQQTVQHHLIHHTTDSNNMVVEKPLWYRWARVGVVGSTIIGTGVLLFKYTTPTDEELIARFSPEVRREYEKNRELRQREQQELMKNAQITAASNDPIWKTGKIASPWDNDTRNTDPKLVDPIKFHQEKADEFKKEQVELAERELAETEKIQAQKKKSWW